MKLQEGETILHELRPRPAILAIWFFSKCLPFGIVGAILAFLASMIYFSTARRPGGGIALAIDICIVAVVGSMALPFAYAVFLRKTYVYWITNLRCVFRGGILRKVERSVPYHKVTDVETTQNIVEQFLSISTLNVYTPGTASAPSSHGGQGAELRFVGLRDSETPAETISKQLRNYKATGE